MNRERNCRPPWRLLVNRPWSGLPGEASVCHPAHLALSEFTRPREPQTRPPPRPLPMEFPSTPGYSASYQAQGPGLSSGHSYAHEPPHTYQNGFNEVQYQNRRGNGVHYGTSNPQAARGLANDSSYGSYGGEPSSKRPRLDGVERNPTPAQSRTNYSLHNDGTPQYTGSQYRGLALPPRPDRPASPSSTAARAPETIQDADGPAQRPQQEEIPTGLEQQVRRLADYTDSGIQRNSTPSSSRRTGQNGIVDNGSDEQTPRPLPKMPERGAKPGNMLNLACEECQLKRQKCTKNFPCTECQSAGKECVPAKRKTRWNRELEEAQAGEEQDEDPQRPPEKYGDQIPGLTYKGWSYESPNRKYLLNLPRAVGSYQEWSNKRLKYNAFPEDLDDVREKLFKMEKPILLNSQQFADYWPHVSNFYCRSTAPTFEDNGTQVEIWECRNKSRLSRQKRELPSNSTGKRKRDNKSHLLESTESCPVRFRIVMYIKHADTDEPHKAGLGHCRCAPEWMLFERKSHSVGEHNHTLESQDKFKRSDALLFFAEHKVEEGGYLYASVIKWIKEKFTEKTNQVRYLTAHDVANAARRWRVQNRHLELVETIEEPTEEEEQGKRCLDLTQTTTADGLKKALAEICARLPEAAGIAIPFLEAAQEARPEGVEGLNKILEGDEIVIPEPGLPQPKPIGRPVFPHHITQQYMPNAPDQPQVRVIGTTGGDATRVVEPETPSYLQVPGVRIAPRPAYLLDSQQAPSPSAGDPSQRTSTPSRLDPAAVGQQHPAPMPSVQLPPPPLVVKQYRSPYPHPQAQPSAPMPPPPAPVPAPHPQPAQQVPTSLPHVVQYSHPEASPSGGHSVSNGGHRHSLPQGSSNVAPQTQAPSQPVAATNHPDEEQRPAWAKSEARPPSSKQGKENLPDGARAESEKAAVQKQLDAELQASTANEWLS